MSNQKMKGLSANVKSQGRVNGLGMGGVIKDKVVSTSQKVGGTQGLIHGYSPSSNRIIAGKKHPAKYDAGDLNNPSKNYGSAPKGY